MTAPLWMLMASMLLWLTILMLPWQPWRCREVLEADKEGVSPDMNDITVLIPARNEEQVIAAVLCGVACQGNGIHVVMVDDESTDGTRRTALDAMEGISIVNGTAPPEGWSGKLWALEQGYKHVRTPFVLLLDADIELQAGIIQAMLDKMHQNELSMMSLMAAPNMSSLRERALMPAFIYFFKLLYPFALSNRPETGVAAAAGGCVMLETRLLDEMDGFATIKDAIIDDCTLAKRIKSAGYRIWIGLTHDAISQRHGSVADMGNMVARTAFTQLHYSWLLLIGCTALLAIAYLVPFTGLFFSGWTFAASLTVLSAMCISYLPVLEFYERSPLWAAFLPLIAAWYLAMTWLSAFRYWKGERSRWKERSYPVLSMNRRDGCACLCVPHADRPDLCLQRIPRKETVAMHTDDRSGELRQGECRLRQRGCPGVLRKRVSPGGRGTRCKQRNKQGRGRIYE